MGRVTARAWPWAGLVWCLASCATLVPPVPPTEPAPAEGPTSPPESKEVVPEPPSSMPSRWLPSLAPEARGGWDAWVPPTPLDLEAWPFGWVSDPETSGALGLSDRFWTDQKPLWRRALDPTTPASAVVRSLEAASGVGGEESLRAAWRLWRAYTTAGLGDRAREWLDRAASLSPSPLLSLERAWDQGFRLHDLQGARALWPGLVAWPDANSARKARLLRQKLFLGARSLAPLGADDFVSTLILDRDDLWAATWNGAVVRWSLTTDQTDLLLPPGPTVAPIKALSVTRWFVYAFQDQNLLRYSKVTGTWRSFPYPPAWTGLRVQGVVADGEESVWVAYLGQGLWHWNQGRWTLVDDGGGGPFLNTLTATSDGFLVGTKDRGLWWWNLGTWTPVPAVGVGPSNISVVEADPAGGRWFVGTWGEGTWILENGVLSPWDQVPDFVTAAAWTERGPVWATLDRGLVMGRGPGQTTVGALDGLAAGGVSSLVDWSGRWIWGTNGQGWGWWSEYENPALLR